MIPNYPYFGLPNYMRYMNPPPTRPPSPPKVSTSAKKSSPPRTKAVPKREEKSDSSPLFSFLGIDFYFDDLLIICILFFLYGENVNDPYLFFALILLLLN